MKKVFPIAVIASLVLISLACSITTPTRTTTSGKTETFIIREDYPPDGDVARLNIEMGAGTLELSGGAPGLIDGEVYYNVSEWRPSIERSVNSLTVRQSNLENVRITTDEIINDWVFKLGQRPIHLTISAGAYKGTLDLSGVPLTNLSISDGASQSTVQFGQPNPIEMELLSYRTGASQVTLVGLANAGPSHLVFEAGAGSYTLDFSGPLQRNMNVSITAGISQVKIIIPEGVSARVTISGGLSNVQPLGTWNISNNVYESYGTGPLIDISLSMGLGNLELIQQ